MMFFWLRTTQGEKVIPWQSELVIFMMTSLDTTTRNLFFSNSQLELNYPGQV